MKYLAILLICVIKLFNRLGNYIFKNSFNGCGKNVRFFPIGSHFDYKNITLNNDIYIGPKANFLAQMPSHIFIGNKVLFGPNVTIIGGDHNTSVKGMYMYDIKIKDQTNDLPIIIEGDNWIGANSTILKGVKISRGAIIGACSLVTKNIPPYSVFAGVPAKFIKFRWSLEELISHDKLLNPDNPLDPTYLKDIFKHYNSST